MNIDGKAVAQELRQSLAIEVKQLQDERGITPGLTVILVGEDPASQVYVRNKGRMTVEAGMQSFEHRLSAETSEADLLALVQRLNADPAVHGILVQLPLPGHMNADLVINAIDPAKDVDGFHISNVGRLGTGQKAMVPCTPLGCLMMLRDHHGSLSGMDAVVIGRSNIVGKPMAQLLLGDSCTVTIAHSRTKDLADVVRRADIVVAAVGRPVGRRPPREGLDAPPSWGWRRRRCSQWYRGTEPISASALPALARHLTNVAASLGAHNGGDFQGGRHRVGNMLHVFAERGRLL